MNDAVLNHFREIAASMQTEPQNWQWIGKHMSQRMFGITKERAMEYAKLYGGVAKHMTTGKTPFDPEIVNGRDCDGVLSR